MTPITQPQSPLRPLELQEQLPDCSCVIEDKCLGGESCAAFTVAMNVSQATGHRVNPSGCDVRAQSHDFSGGLNMAQVVDLYHHYGVAATGRPGTITPGRMATLSRAGHAIHLMGNTGALIGHPEQSTSNAVNHSVALSGVYGGKTLEHPEFGIVYDSCADGRKRSYHVDKGPSGWPWARVLAFAARLEPASDGRRLGTGSVYCVELPSTGPRITLRFGARRTSPRMPDRARADRIPDTRVHSAPRKGDATVIRKLDEGTLVFLYQVTDKGESFGGSSTWYGNPEGTEWIHSLQLRQIGGPT